MQHAQTPFERGAYVRRNNPSLDQPRGNAGTIDCTVAGHAKTRIDA